MKMKKNNLSKKALITLAILVVIGVGTVFVMEFIDDSKRSDFYGNKYCYENNLWRVGYDGTPEMLFVCGTDRTCYIAEPDGVFSFSTVQSASSGEAGCKRIVETQEEAQEIIDNDNTIIEEDIVIIENCGYGEYLENNVCVDYPGKNLPNGLNFEQCIVSALDNYYAQFGATDYDILSWITGKEMELDEYTFSGTYKYIGCASIRDTNGAWSKWGVTANCKITKYDLLSSSQASSHDICGSERLRG